MSINTYKAYKIEKNEFAELKVKRKKSVPWDEICDLLVSGYGVFLHIERRTAHYIKKQLENKLTVSVSCSPCIYRNMSGYSYTLNFVEEALKKWKRK